MGGHSSSSTTSSVAATNPGLNQLFTQMFMSGGAQGAMGTLQGIMSGDKLQTNTSQLYSTLQKASQPQYMQGLAQIRESAGRAGLSDSTSLLGATGGYNAQYLANLTNLSTQMGLQETQVQGGVAGNLMSLLGTAASQYFTDKSTTVASMPWTQGFNAIMQGAMGLGSMFGIGMPGGTGTIQGLFGG